jgi:dTDP-4-dehydrorhamnose 3,5-epimerase
VIYYHLYMEFEASRLAGVYVVRFEPRTDFRGAFTEIWNAKAWITAGIPFRVDQVNVSESTHRGTVRGMHYQAAPFSQKKIVRCVRGAVFDVAVDIRPGSPTYGDWAGIELHDDSNSALYVPEGFAHGWQALEHGSSIEYLTEGFWDRDSERGVSPLNRKVGIQWPGKVEHVIDRDLGWPALT